MSYEIWALMNVIVCAAIMGICVCRLSLCHPGISMLVRLKHTMLLTGSFAYGFQPLLFNDWPTRGGVILSASVLVGLMCSAYRWHGRPPKDAAMRPSQFGSIRRFPKSCRRACGARGSHNAQHS